MPDTKKPIRKDAMNEEQSSEQSICVQYAECRSRLSGEQSDAPTVARWNPWLEIYEEVKV